MGSIPFCRRQLLVAGRALYRGKSVQAKSSNGLGLRLA
jgi:hypothetical protein